MAKPKRPVKSDARRAAEAETLTASDHSASIRSAEAVRKAPYPSAPTSVRLSAPLLERLDALANAQHRTRGNLIQHILWEHINPRKDEDR